MAFLPSLLARLGTGLISRKNRRTIFNTTQSLQFPSGFYFCPNYFSREEQRTLLAASLFKLDNLETRQARRKRKNFWDSMLSGPAVIADRLDPAELFAPDEMYDFAEGHYDEVIHHFREMHLSSWPTEHYPGLQPVLDRLYSLCPTDVVQTHLLHLASYGEILPHVDNISASGSWILGVSLGDERMLHLKEVDGKGEEFSLSLPPGSAYLQRDEIRFNYLHSIERGKAVGQRLSIMIRDQNTSASSLS